NYGSKATKPSDPTKEGFTFIDWFSEVLGRVWDFLTDLVTTDTTLTAKWQANPSSSSEASSSSSEDTSSSSSSEGTSSSSSSEDTSSSSSEDMSSSSEGTSSSSSDGDSSSSNEDTSSSSSSDDTPSSSSEGSTPIQNRVNPIIGAIGVQTIYYNLKGEPLGTTKPATPGVYIEKQGKLTKRIVVR
ncbi:MAG: InlB B-repeat-containing protein, partial [Fibromonadales bacterium]|nr:InlB B-repeat-containing protein [Fibromonadales bacterium]